MMGRELLNKLRRESQREQLWRDGHVARPVDLEEAEAQQREHDRLLDYREALLEERRGVEVHLRRAESLGDDERVEVPFTAPHQWPSAAALASELRARLEGIDAEIERVSR